MGVDGEYRNKVIGIIQIGENVYSPNFFTYSLTDLKWIDRNAYQYNKLYKIKESPLFSKCKQLKTIPDGLFDGLEITKENTFDASIQPFVDCHSLEYVPDDLFANVKGTNIRDITCDVSFIGCHKLTNIPKGFLNDISKLGKIIQINYTFMECFNIKEVP